MSRIGKKPVPLPKGVAVNVQGDRVLVKGPKGNLDLSLPAGIRADVKKDAATVERSSSSQQQRALHGLVRSLINNMVTGVSREL